MIHYFAGRLNLQLTKFQEKLLLAMVEEWGEDEKKKVNILATI